MHQLVVSIPYNLMMVIFHINFDMVAVVGISQALPIIQENTYDPILFEEYTKLVLKIILFVTIILK